MSKEQPAPELPPAAPPEMIPEPAAVAELEKSGYQPASQDVTAENLADIENFIGSIYGEAKRIDQANIGDNQFTKGVKLDAHKEIVTLRNSVKRSGQQPPQPQQPHQLQQPQLPDMQATYQRPVQPSPAPVVPAGDSLILKHEIDQLKDQLKDIKKLYDEFFKLKFIKGSWNITVDGKTQKAPSIAKAWNIINKKLKSKEKQIIINYTEDE